MPDCRCHKHLTEAQILAMTEVESAVCDNLWRAWLVLQVKPEGEVK